MQKKFKILLITGHFFPENNPRSLRATELAKVFAREGHDISVGVPQVTDQLHCFCADHGIELKAFGKMPSGIDFTRGGRLTKLWKRILRRILLTFFAYPSIAYRSRVYRLLKAEKSRYDLLISNAVPHSIHWGVARAWKKNYKVADTWVADCGDPFVGVSYESIGKPFYFHWLENGFLKRADYISVPFKDLITFFNPNYASKFLVIPQGFEFSIQDAKEAHEPLNIVPTFMYSGTIMPGLRDPFILLDFLLEKGLDFKFVVYTGQGYLFEKYAAELDKKIYLRDYIPRVQLIEEMRGMDFLLNIQTFNASHSVTNAIPSKLIDYRISGRPILDLNHGKLDTEKLMEFMHGDYSQRFVLKDFEKYHIDRVSQQFIDCISEK